MARLENPASAISDGRKEVTTAGTRVQLSTTGVRCRSLVITAESNNTGLVVVGGATVVADEATRRGLPLDKGQSVSLDIDDLSKVWLDATVSTDGVTFTYTG